MTKIEKYRSEYNKYKIFDTAEECEEYDKKYSALNLYKIANFSRVKIDSNDKDWIKTYIIDDFKNEKDSYEKVNDLIEILVDTIFEDEIANCSYDIDLTELYNIHGKSKRWKDAVYFELIDDCNDFGEDIIIITVHSILHYFKETKKIYENNKEKCSNLFSQKG
jgi:hypothetical protein